MSPRQSSFSVRHTIGAAALAASLLLAGCASSTDSSGTSPSPSASENATSKPDVVSSSVGDLTTPYTSETGHFSVSFPGKPETTKQESSALGATVTVEATQWVDGDKMLAAAVTPLPAGTITDANRQSVLSGSISGAASSSGGSLDGDPQPVTIDGLTGLRATVKNVQGSSESMDIAVLFDGNTQIVLMAHPSDAFDPFASTFQRS